MSALTIHQRQALRYAMTKTDGDREVAAQRARHADSSTPTLRHWFEDRGGWLVLLLVCAAVFVLTACAGTETRQPPKPDAVPTCSHGRQVQQVGTYGPDKVPVLVSTYRACRSRR